MARRVMRILLAIHNCYTDSTSGAAHSMRIMMQWLAEGGHQCRVLGTARFDARPPDSIDSHLTELGVELRRSPPSKAFIRSVRKPANLAVGRPTVDFTLNDVPVKMLLTRAALGSVADQMEAAQLLFVYDELLRSNPPDIVVTYGGHPAIQEMMRRARANGVTTVFSLHNRGYENRDYFKYSDYVFTASPYFSEVYRQKIGLRSVGLESPIDWDEVEAPPDLRKFVTFVNPSRGKGSLLFARLAEMLGQSRPDIPLLIVQSAASAGGLNEIGIDFTKHPQIMVAPPTTEPSTYFGLTKILLVPSVVNESFGRVAAEALINGIPPIVSNRGALPETVRGAGRVIAVPDWLTETTTTLPDAADAQPWFDAVVALWDDQRAYAEACGVARRVGADRYGEDLMRRKYLDYFASLRPGEAPPLFDDAGRG